VRRFEEAVLTGAEQRQPGIAKLLQLRGFSDAKLGIAERFLTPAVGGGSTIAVLSTPLGATHDVGWVMCHAFGLDQINLQPFEVPLARALAAAGFPVIRYHSQGFGDSELPTEHISLKSLVGDALEVAALLRAEAEVASIGIFGARLGGTVAALSAADAEAAAIALWDPVANGRGYAARLARFSSASELVTQGRAQTTGRNPADVLRETGVLDVQGIPVPAALFEELRAIDLTSHLNSFRGRSLVVQPSRSTKRRAELEALVRHLNDLGGESTLEVVIDPHADKFGQPRFVGKGDGIKVDEMESLATSLTEVTMAWCASVVERSA
jgi:pimeloyl-ACP methyl ester carboxylesterase